MESIVVLTAIHYAPFMSVADGRYIEALSKSIGCPFGCYFSCECLELDKWRKRDSIGEINRNILWRENLSIGN